MGVNLELKARVPSPERLAAVAQKIGAESAGVLIQEDTYFKVARGRLKLREIRGAPSELVYYEREENRDERWSAYETIPVGHAPEMKALLARVLGIKTVVKKVRRLFLQRGARIHLDEVESLGSFLEFEVPEGSDAERQMEELRSAFEVHDADVIRCSYSDLILGKRIPPES